MTKIDVITGFYGAGKTTLIQKIMSKGIDKNTIAYLKISTCDGEFDSFTLERDGIHGFEIKVTPKMERFDEALTAALQNIFELYEPNRILIESAGNIATKQILDAIQPILIKDHIEKNVVAFVVDAKMVVENAEKYPHIFREHIEQAQTVILRGRERLNEAELYACEMAIRKFNSHATVIVDEWEELDPNDFRNSIEVTAQLEGIVRNITAKENMPLVYDFKKSVKEKVLQEQEKIEGITIHTDTIYTKELIEEIVSKLLKKNPSIFSIKANFRTDNKKTLCLRYLQGDLKIWEEAHYGSGNIQMIGNSLDTNSLSEEII